MLIACKAACVDVRHKELPINSAASKTILLKIEAPRVLGIIGRRIGCRFPKNEKAKTQSGRP